MGILRGDPLTLMERDVHGLENLGDRAGYAVGQQRSERLGYLQWDQPLQVGRVVTIKPGFYQVSSAGHLGGSGVATALGELCELGTVGPVCRCVGHSHRG
ncbi:MAG: hypothetical protein ACUVRV_08320 [Cyanobacteriota bacterium]